MPTLIPSNSRSVLFYSPPLSTHSNEVFTYLALWINIRTKLLSLQFKRDVGRTFFGSIMRLPNTNDKYICTIDQSCIITFTLFHDVLLFYTFHTNYNCSNIIDMQCFKELFFIGNAPLFAELYGNSCSHISPWLISWEES